MRLPSPPIILLGCILTLATTALPASAAPSDPVPAGIAAIIAQEDAAWMNGDAAAFAANVTPDVVFTNVVGMFSVGKVPFQAQHERIFATIYQGSTVTQDIAHVAFPAPGVAIVDTLAKVRGYKRLPPGAEAIDGALQTRLEQVMVERDGRWMVASFHNVPINPAATQPPAK